MDAQDAQDNQDRRPLRDPQSLKYKPLITKEFIWISLLRFPHYIPFIEKEPPGQSRTLVERSAEYQP